MRRTRPCVAVTLLLAAAIFVKRPAAQGPSPPPPFPPPGRLVDVGGWRLHVNCTGESAPGQPTVILEAGLGDFSVEWSLVQPRVARFARVCSYDRGGDGWSDLGPDPRTLHQIVGELRTLLQKAEVSPPYVLVGHSYGGWLVRLYAYSYPGEVSGMVLVDAGADDPLRLTADGGVKRSSELVKGRPVPPVKTSGPLREADVPPMALGQMKAAAERSAIDANPGSRRMLPAEAQRMRSWALARWQHMAAANNPVEIDELADFRVLQGRSQHPLGDRPLIVLTRGLPEEEGPDANALEADHRKEQAAMATLSTAGTLVIAAGSAHHIQLDEPDLMSHAISDVLRAVRK